MTRTDLNHGLTHTHTHTSGRTKAKAGLARSVFLKWVDQIWGQSWTRSVPEHQIWQTITTATAKWTGFSSFSKKRWRKQELRQGHQESQSNEKWSGQDQSEKKKKGSDKKNKRPIWFTRTDQKSSDRTTQWVYRTMSSLSKSMTKAANNQEA